MVVNSIEWLNSQRQPSQGKEAQEKRGGEDQGAEALHQVAALALLARMQGKADHGEGIGAEFH